MQHQCAGKFDVKITPQPGDAVAGDAIARMVLDKTFHGELEATSKGHMLAFRSSVKGSAGYVAIEFVTGTLLGKSGSFVLQHSGTMSRGAAKLDLHVVPDSATGDLLGLGGTMEIEIVDGVHHYRFAFSFPKESN
jgi:hypothetical protein